jgi:hypothetical protein
MLVYMAKIGMVAVGRILAPYYVPLAAPLLMADPEGRIVRRGWWRKLSAAVFILALLPIALMPGRPMVPVEDIFGFLRKVGARRSLVSLESYYRRPPDDFLTSAPALLPPDATIIGFLPVNEVETSLWRPFGSRRVVRVFAGDPPEFLRAEGIHYVLVNARAFGESPEPFGKWLADLGGDVIFHTTTTATPFEKSADWYLIKLRQSTGAD